MPQPGKPAEPFDWEKVPWNVLITLGVIILVGAMVAGFYQARRAG